jgi:transcriptional regulator with XRE-family HTH domain
MSTAKATLLTRAEQLGDRLAAQRLNRNLTQRQLADDAGVALNTLRRLEAGENVSLDTLIRVLEALGLGDRLEALAPPADVRPVDRVRIAAGRERRRASGAGAEAPTTPWTWGDDQ